MVPVREGEVRLAHAVTVASADGRLPPGTRVAILGVPEDIGIRANMGRPGARRMWRAFLPRFLSMQSNPFLDGSAVCIAGTVDVRDLRRAVRDADPNAIGPRTRADGIRRLREATAEIDQRVADVVAGIRAQGAVAVVVGGGHNNAFGILAGCSRTAGAPMGCVNIDLHADLRPAEGRHSGNGFTYARMNGHLGPYAIVGMSEAYATRSIVDSIRADPGILAITLESMLRGEQGLDGAVQLAAAHVGNAPCTLEIDLDAVAQAPASAAAASGFTGAEVRAMASRLSARLKVHAVHVAEGAPGLGPWSADMLGKLVAEIVRDAATGACSR